MSSNKAGKLRWVFWVLKFARDAPIKKYLFANNESQGLANGKVNDLETE